MSSIPLNQAAAGALIQTDPAPLESLLGQCQGSPALLARGRVVMSWEGDGPHSGRHWGGFAPILAAALEGGSCGTAGMGRGDQGPHATLGSSQGWESCASSCRRSQKQVSRVHPPFHSLCSWILRLIFPLALANATVKFLCCCLWCNKEDVRRHRPQGSGL